MTALDLIRIGLPMLAGAMLSVFSIRRALPTDRMRRLPEAFRSGHARLQERLIRGKIVRIPGACLADPVRPWVIGEAVGAIILVCGLSTDLTLARAVRIGPTALLLGGVAAWMALANASREALRSVRRDLPVACFLLSLLLESGMGASAALQETVLSLPPGPLHRELGELIRARSFGVSRGESIERSRERVPIEDYRLFLNHILQGERLGIGLSRSLREISAKMLESQDHRAETIAQQAAVKLLFPLVCFIFPAVFLIILSPVILGLWDRFSR